MDLMIKLALSFIRHVAQTHQARFGPSGNAKCWDLVHNSEDKCTQNQIDNSNEHWIICYGVFPIHHFVY